MSPGLITAPLGGSLKNYPMNKLFAFLFFFVCSVPSNSAAESKGGVSQSPEIREFCKKAQDIEKQILQLRANLESINQKERMSTPIIRNIYEILTRCFMILLDIQRFSNFLVLNQQDSRNDFIRCSIIIKNFTTYFKTISSQLGKAENEVTRLREDKIQNTDQLRGALKEHDSLLGAIERIVSELAKNREENIIQNDVVCHLATKSESLEELDAELEAENAIGVLRNTKISTELSISYPVTGKIVSEFGDKGADGEMIYYLAFETCPSAVVTSPVKGLVVFSGNFLNYGNMLIISNGDYRIFLYGMDVLFTATGDIVDVGDYVGKMEDKAVSTNHIVKIELKKSGEPLDPRHWLFETIQKAEKNK